MNEILEESVKSEIMDDPQPLYFSEFNEEEVEKVKVEVKETDSPETSETYAVEKAPFVLCDVSTIVPKKKRLTLPKKVSKIDLQPVYLDILPGADPRTRKLPLFVVKNGPDTYHFKFAEISLDQFKPNHTSELVCSNHPLCKCRILAKNLQTADVKTEEFHTFKNWEILPPKRISSLQLHECNGPIPQQFVEKEDTATTSIQSVLHEAPHPRETKTYGISGTSRVLFSIKIKDNILKYGAELHCLMFASKEGPKSHQLKKGRLFRPVTINCVHFPDCSSSLQIFAKDTVDANDEDFFTLKNWEILKGKHVLTHNCLAKDFAEILRGKKEEREKESLRVYLKKKEEQNRKKQLEEKRKKRLEEYRQNERERKRKKKEEQIQEKKKEKSRQNTIERYWKKREGQNWQNARELYWKKREEQKREKKLQKKSKKLADSEPDPDVQIPNLWKVNVSHLPPRPPSARKQPKIVMPNSSPENSDA